MNVPKGQFMFPILPKQDIIRCMNELGFRISERDLDDPNPQQMIEIYEFFVTFLMGVSQQDMHQVQFSGIDQLDHPELYDKSCGRVLFIRSLAKLMQIVGIKDFSLRSLIKPTQKQTKRYLSGLINFAKFREGKISAYAEYITQTDQLQEEQNELQDENSELLNRFEEMKEKRKTEKPMINELRSEVERLTEELTALNKEQALKNGEINTMKAEGRELKEQLREKREKIALLKEQVETLTSRIVRSPEKMTRQIEDLRETLEKSKLDMQDEEKRLRDLKAKESMLEKTRREADRCLSMMFECETEKRKLREMKVKAAEHKAQRDIVEQEMDQLKTAKEVLLLHLKGTEERFEKNNAQNAEKLAAMDEAVQFIKRQKAEMEKEKERIQAGVRENDEKHKRILAEIEETRVAHEEAMSRLRETESSFRDGLPAFHENLFHMLNTGSPTM